MKKLKVAKPFRIGAKVQWNWMGLKVHGVVKKIFFKPVQKTIRGHLFRRNSSIEKPAYLVVSKAGNDVLKSHSELKT